MKTKVCCILFSLLPLFVSAQNDTDTLKAYMFDKFEQGTANYKNGTLTNSLFNYNFVSGKIMFKQNNVAYELDNVSDIAHITIGNHIFFRIKNDVFCERFIIDAMELYVYWRYQVQSAGKKGAYGTTSQTSSITGISQLTQDGHTYNLQTVENLSLSTNNAYYIYLNGKYNRISSAKSLAKLFKNNQEEIKGYCRREKIDFNKFEDIKRVVSFCGKFSN
jgi:hypothetical protein